MGKVYTLESFNIELKNRGIEYICVEFNGYSKKSKFYCIKHDYYFDAISGNVLIGKRRCTICSGKIHKHTVESFNKKLEERGIKYKVVGSYTNNSTRTDFYCEEHDHIFDATPASILSKTKSCEYCIDWFWTPESYNEFLVENNKNLLCYEFISTQKNVKHECLVCGHGKNGEWTPKPNDILNGGGCPKCWISSRSFSKEEVNFKIKDKNVILTGEYSNCYADCTFKCLTCDYEWEDAPNNILRREYGCPVCDDKLPPTFESFNKKLEESGRSVRLIGEYIKSDEKTTFKCLVCDHEWDAVPSSIKQGTGCPKCANKISLTFEEVNQKLENENRTVRLIDNYINASKRTTFICLVCGHIWDAIVDNILRNRNCPSCAKTGFDPSKPAILYYLKINHGDNEYYKIGITNKTVEKRFKKYEMKTINVLNVLNYDCGVDAYNIEQKILRIFCDYRYNGEPILNSGGNTEIFIKDIFEGNYEQINYI